MRTLVFLGLLPAVTACTETATVEVFAVQAQPGTFFEAGIVIWGHVDGNEERPFKLKFNGQYVMLDPYVPNPDFDGVERVWSRGGLGFAVPPDEYVIELEDDELGIVLRSSPITLAAGSNHMVVFGELSQLEYVVNHDAPHPSSDTTRARVTNTLSNRQAVDILLCPGDTVPPASTCEEAMTDLAHGETWEAVIPVGLRVHARPPRPDNYTDPSDFTFNFTPDHWYNGSPEDETVCTRCTMGSLYPFDWGEGNCPDPSSFCLDVFETHDNRFGSFDDPNACDPPDA